MPKDTARISPTAHYTGAVWRSNGLGDERLDGVLNRSVHRWVSPAGALVRPFLGGATLDTALLQRHRFIDHIVREALHAGATRVIEVPAGFSARGLRFAADHPTVRWIDGDLTQLAALRREALGPGHRVEVIDLLADAGPHALSRFEGDEPTVVIVEGLFNYFPTPVVLDMWVRIARFLARCRGGWMTGDIALGSHVRNPLVRMFLLALGAIARGRMTAHFDGPADARETLMAAGFEMAELLSPKRHAAALRLPVSDVPDYLAMIQARVGTAADAPTLTGARCGPDPRDADGKTGAVDPVLGGL